DPDAVNNSPIVGSYARIASELYDVLFVSTDDVGNALTFVSGKRAFFMDVYTDAPIGSEILLQLENSALSASDYPSGRHSRYTATTSVQNGWERLEFELSDRPDISVGAFDIDQIVLLLAPNSSTSYHMHFDNLVSMQAPDQAILQEEIIADFDGTMQITEFFSDGVWSDQVPNPYPNGVNDSPTVGSYTRNSESQYDVISFNSSVIENAGSFKNGDNVFFLDVYTSAPAGTEISISLENESNSDNPYPQGRNSSYAGVVETSNAWHTISFIYSGAADAGTSDLAIDEITLLFDPNSSNSDTYFIDNFRYGITALPPSYNFDQMIQDYDGINNLSFNPSSTGVYTSNVTNPSPNGVNGSSLAGEYVRNATEQYDVLSFSTNVIPDASAYATEDKRFAADVYTDAPIGTIISFQLEASTIANPNNYPAGRHSVYQAAVKEQNSWHSLVFVLTNTPDLLVADNEVDRTIILFDPGQMSSHTYYIDNIRSLAKEIVIPDPVLTSIQLSPSDISIDENTTQQFSAQGFDQFDEPLATSFSWSATGGVINTEGLYTGSEVGSFIVTATSGDISATATVTVNSVPIIGQNFPGIIQAEDYDEGGEGMGYHDLTAGNFGGAYRQEDVDIETTGDVEGGFNVGWMDAGEWLSYTLNVTQSGTYSIGVRAASPNGNGIYQLDIDGQDISGNVSVPNTGSWQSYTTLTTDNIVLPEGTHVLRFNVVSNGLNINFLEGTEITNPILTSIQVTPADQVINEGETVLYAAQGFDQNGNPFNTSFNWTTTGGSIDPNGTFIGTTPGTYEVTASSSSVSGSTQVTVLPTANVLAIPGRIEAEDYTSMSGVQSQGTADTGGGENIGWIDAGDWMEYQVNVANTGSYDVDIRVAALGSSTKSLQLMSGSTVLAVV
ncbi:MAG: carbohydrate-binding protein, partial [Saprospiraceae bacterium]|nr:carbohydrate-binding protein [Saprospiraceae bacterium]